MSKKSISFFIVLWVTFSAQAETGDYSMTTFELPAGIDQKQYQNVLTFLDGGNSALTVTEKEYWKHRQELAEVATSTLKRLNENDEVIDKKLLKILVDVTHRKGSTVDDIMNVDYFSESEQTKIAEAIDKMSPKDPGLDSIANQLKNRVDAIFDRLKRLNAEIQSSSKKDPAKHEFYQAQALYDDINREVFLKHYQYIRSNRVSTLNLLAIFNDYANANDAYQSSKTPEKHLAAYEKFAQKNIIHALLTLTLAYAGSENSNDAQLPENQWSEEKSLNYANQACELGSYVGCGQLASIYPEKNMGLRYAVIYYKIENKGKSLSLTEAKEYYGSARDIDLYLKAGLIKVSESASESPSGPPKPRSITLNAKPGYGSEEQAGSRSSNLELSGTLHMVKFLGSDISDTGAYIYLRESHEAWVQVSVYQKRESDKYLVATYSVSANKISNYYNNSKQDDDINKQSGTIAKFPLTATAPFKIKFKDGTATISVNGSVPIEIKTRFQEVTPFFSVAGGEAEFTISP